MKDPYSATVRRLFANPEHARQLGDSISVVHEDQQLQVTLQVRVHDGRIEATAFNGWGCPHFVAACEAWCASMEGKEVAELAQFDAAGLMQSLAVPAEKAGRILVLEDAVRALTKALESAQP